MPHFEAMAVQGTGNQQCINLASIVKELTTSAISGKSSGHFCDPACENSANSDVILNASQCRLLEQGLRQRFEAINACLDEIVRWGRLPGYLCESGFLAARIRSSFGALKDAVRSEVAWTWFGSTDLYLNASGELTVVDQNFSLPTGLQGLNSIQAGRTDVRSAATGLTLPEQSPKRGIAVMLTPGAFSSSGPGNEFIAKSLNIISVQSADLFVRGGSVYLRAGGKEHLVSTIVRRVDDDLLDPNCFRPESLVGVPGLIKAWKNGGVDVLSPPGASVAGCRSFGKYVPKMIDEFLGEEPLLPCAPVLECEDADVLKYVMANVRNFAIRTNDPLHPARPFFGRTGTAVEFADLLSRLRKNPAAYVARPLLDEQESSDRNLRVFGTMTSRFRLIPGYITRSCQPDGGAAYSL